MKIPSLIILTFVILLIYATPSYAYIDPLGNMLLHWIGGGLAVLLLTLRIFWHRILIFFGLRKEENEEPTALP